MGEIEESLETSQSVDRVFSFVGVHKNEHLHGGPESTREGKKNQTETCTFVSLNLHRGEKESKLVRDTYHPEGQPSRKNYRHKRKEKETKRSEEYLD